MDRAQNAMSQITQGSIAAIFDNTPGRVEYPILQCVQVKKINSQEEKIGQEGKTGQEGSVQVKKEEKKNPERYRITLNDVRNWVHSALSITANGLVHSGSLKRGCIVRLKGYQANAIKEKKYGDASVSFDSYLTKTES